MPTDIDQEIGELQREIDRLAAAPDEELEERYALRQPSKPAGFYWQLRWAAGRVLRTLRSITRTGGDPWPPALKHGGRDPRARAVVIWAVGFDARLLRDACTGIEEAIRALPDRAPVLVTDTADFAFFSRLGWLVEYVPHIDGANSYARRKQRFLARLYHGAPMLPPAVGLGGTATRSRLRKWLDEFD